MAKERFASVWDALADTPKEAANLRLRSKLMMELADLVSSWNLSQEQAAARLGINQPRVNYLLTGKIDKFSIDTLVNLLDAANAKINVTITHPKKTA